MYALQSNFNKEIRAIYDHQQSDKLHFLGCSKHLLRWQKQADLEIFLISRRILICAVHVVSSPALLHLPKLRVLAELIKRRLKSGNSKRQPTIKAFPTSANITLIQKHFTS